MNGLQIGTLRFTNPVLTASGTFGMGDMFADFMDYSRIGGITLKTVTTKPRAGNRPPRILETPCGLLNSIGLENHGHQAVLAELRTENYLKDIPTNVIFSIAGDTIQDFVDMARDFSAIEGISMLELNLSCPNVHSGGRTFDADCDNVRAIVESVGAAISIPFTTKLSPNVDIVSAARAAEAAGSPALTISNTFLGMAINIKTGDFVFKNKVAGFSGPAVKPLALYNVYKVAQEVKVPLIASGGVSSVEDALEFIMAGATFISTGTFNFVEPDIALVIAQGLDQYYNKKN